MQLEQNMGNGASVKDWLGTAASTARIAALRLEELRAGQRLDKAAAVLGGAVVDLEQALSEVRAVLERVTSDAPETAAERAELEGRQ